MCVAAVLRGLMISCMHDILVRSFVLCVRVLQGCQPGARHERDALVHQAGVRVSRKEGWQPRGGSAKDLSSVHVGSIGVGILQ